MDARVFILSELRAFCRREPLRAGFGGFTWDDITFLRSCLIRLEHGDDSAWNDFTRRLDRYRELRSGVLNLLEDLGFFYFDPGTSQMRMGAFPLEIKPLTLHDADVLLQCLGHEHSPDVVDELPDSGKTGRSEIMYIEAKPGLTGPARIGRVTFSKTGKTVYYRSHRFRSLKGCGYKANYRDVETRIWYWISRCRADGEDTLYPGIVEIDDDVREEYWHTIRRRPGMDHLASFRSEGKYSRRRPQPAKPNHPASGPRRRRRV
jgi:hypothetical protein